MGIFSSISRRTGLFNKMADTVGVDLGEVIVHDETRATDLRSAVIRCAGCRHDGECQAWMESESSHDAAPDYCRNKAMLDGLASK